MRVEEITALYDIEPAECVALLLKLEKIGILELHENNRIRLRLARTFAWIPDGPIMRYAKSQCADFFNYAFSGPGQLMRMITVRITREAFGGRDLFCAGAAKDDAARPVRCRRRETHVPVVSSRRRWMKKELPRCAPNGDE